jgi:hypothetical protein
VPKKFLIKKIKNSNFIVRRLHSSLSLLSPQLSSLKNNNLKRKKLKSVDLATDWDMDMVLLEFMELLPPSIQDIHPSQFTLHTDTVPTTTAHTQHTALTQHTRYRECSHDKNIFPRSNSKILNFTELFGISLRIVILWWLLWWLSKRLRLWQPVVLSYLTSIKKSISHALPASLDCLESLDKAKKNVEKEFFVYTRNSFPLNFFMTPNMISNFDFFL